MMLTSILIPFLPNCSKKFVAKNNSQGTWNSIFRGECLSYLNHRVCDDICHNDRWWFLEERMLSTRVLNLSLIHLSLYLI